MNNGGRSGERRRHAFDFDYVNESSSRYGGICDATIAEIVGEEYPNPVIRRAYQSESRNLAPVTIRQQGQKRVKINNLVERVAAIYYLIKKTNDSTEMSLATRRFNRREENFID